MKEETMLTTSDNPFNPFTDYDSWYEFDVINGYHTCALLGRVSTLPTDVDESDLEQVKHAIIRFNHSGKHLLVTKRNWKVQIAALAKT
jgi:hypothetical protein